MAMLTWVYPGRNGVSRVIRYIAMLAAANTAAKPTISHQETGTRRARRTAARRATPSPSNVQRARVFASTYWRCAARLSSASWAARAGADMGRSEEHTSELQSPDHLVCLLPLEKKNRQMQ